MTIKAENDNARPTLPQEFREAFLIRSGGNLFTTFMGAVEQNKMPFFVEGEKRESVTGIRALLNTHFLLCVQLPKGDIEYHLVKDDKLKTLGKARRHFIQGMNPLKDELRPDPAALVRVHYDNKGENIVGVVPSYQGPNNQKLKF